MIDIFVFHAGSLAFFVAFLTATLLVLTKRHHGAFTLDGTEGIQKMHRDPTPRVGGVAVAAGYFAAWLFLEGPVADMWALIGLSGILAFGFGLCEDLTRKVSVRVRLGATIASGLTFALLSGYTITHIDLWGFDALLSLSLVSLAFTGFAIGGAANAINIIDGFHGLASGTLLIILGAFALMASRVGDTTLTSVSLLMMTVVLGFFVLNYPYGKLFLGDAGAYFSGYFVATLAVMLPARNPEVSPWISLLILGYPVTETIVSMVRRWRRKDGSAGRADNQHLHHRVYRVWARRMAERFGSPANGNAWTSPLLWWLPLLTLVLSGFSSLNSQIAIIYVAIEILIYVAYYRSIFAWDKISEV